jgi:hypothetical protein
MDVLVDMHHVGLDAVAWEPGVDEACSMYAVAPKVSSPTGQVNCERLCLACFGPEEV